LTDPTIQTVLQWLRTRTEAEDEWLVISDNADDISSEIQKIMPKGNRGTIIITSQDTESARLIPKACEKVRIKKDLDRFCPAFNIA
jgi:hypothetical protein